jgi:hypothetical protein
MLWAGKWRPLDSVDFARRNGPRAWPFGPVEIASSVQAVSDWFGVAIKPGLAAAASLDHDCYSVGLRIVPIRVESEPNSACTKASARK